MAIVIGQQLGSYEITSLLGEGGMGQVYRARDTRLKRDVAIKILPDEFSRDADRVARFQREAEVLASLNHPNIAAIYDLEEANALRFLVLELVEGETLAERIRRGRIPVGDALKIAHQIAEAFEAAHEKGVIHRDLKPANVKITPEGKVKVLDFGLAKALEAAPQQAASNSPTMLTAAATNGGMILGTAGYMSPEQARGQAADQRSDIFSFGCVLFEMLTGRETFPGETVTDVIASVVAREPDWQNLPADVHPGIDSLIRRCLAKNRKNRWHAVADVRVELETIMADPLGGKLKPITSVERMPLWLRAVPIVVAFILGIALTAAVFWNRHPSQTGAVTRFPLAVPEGQVFTGLTRHLVAISPDGTNVVYVANQQLYLRTMAEMETRPIQGTYQVPDTPFFSPDGRWVAFYAQGRIKKMALSGGAAVPICDADEPYGASWSSSNEIFIGQGAKGILKVSPDGGKPQTVVKMKPGELAQSPQLLPGGDALLFTLANTSSVSAAGNRDLWDRAQIVVQSLRSGERKILIEGGSDGRFAPTGHIVYALGSSLLAVRFDVRKLEVNPGPVSIVEGAMRAAGITGAAEFSFSDNGSMIYVPEAAGLETRSLAMVDRAGVRKPLNVPPAPYQTPRVSPNGEQLTFFTDDGKNRIVWIYDLNGTTPMRQLTFGGNNHRPVWTADGQRIVFTSDREGDQGLFWQRSDGNGAERLAKLESSGSPQSEMWSTVGNTLLFSVSGPPRSLWTFSPSDPKPKQLISLSGFSASNGTFSPDGKWIAYFSGESGENEIYVQPFPLTGTKYKVSTGGGMDPVWSPDEKHLFYTRGPVIGARQIMAVDIQTEPTFVPGKTTPLPIEGLVATGPRNYDITPDGKYFVVVLPSNQTNAAKGAAQQFYVTLNWLEELKQRVPVK